MGDVSKVLGKPIPFTYKGTTYELSPLTYALQAKFEYWLENRAVEALERRKDGMTPAEYEKKYGQLIGDIAAGVYSFGGEYSVKAAKALPGLKELFFISLSARHGEVTRQFVDEIFEYHMTEALATFNAANKDPLAKRPTV